MFLEYFVIEEIIIAIIEIHGSNFNDDNMLQVTVVATFIEPLTCNDACSIIWNCIRTE